MTTCKECAAQLLGACYGDFCEMERTCLTEQVVRVALEGGHSLGSSEKEAGRPLWRAACVRCGLEISYTLDPGPDSPAIYGPLLDVPCKVTG